MPSCEVAKNLGVNETTLRTALVAAGYERISPERHGQLAMRAPRASSATAVGASCDRAQQRARRAAHDRQ